MCHSWFKRCRLGILPMCQPWASKVHKARLTDGERKTLNFGSHRSNLQRHKVSSQILSQKSLKINLLQGKAQLFFWERDLDRHPVSLAEKRTNSFLGWSGKKRSKAGKCVQMDILLCDRFRHKEGMKPVWREIWEWFPNLMVLQCEIGVTHMHGVDSRFQTGS